MKIRCAYNKKVEHEFPDDWEFGGANNTHPGADPRWTPLVHLYFDERLNVVHRTSMMTCDEMAKAFVVSYEQAHRTSIHYIQRVVPGGKNVTIWSAP